MNLRLRDVGPDVPARMSDYCACDRGREALRRAKEGKTVCLNLFLFLPECDCCDPKTGLLLYTGWTCDDNVVLINPDIWPPTPPRTS